ncbi:unnamed protein product, partial [Rotaria sordida]
TSSSSSQTNLPYSSLPELDDIDDDCLDFMNEI